MKVPEVPERDNIPPPPWCLTSLSRNGAESDNHLTLANSEIPSQDGESTNVWLSALSAALILVFVMVGFFAVIGGAIFVLAHIVLGVMNEF